MYLLALGIATLVGGLYTATELRENVIKADKEVAVVEANSVAQVVSASAAWMTQQGSTVATATYTDVSFLQDASCGGTAAKEYLPCTWTAPVRTGVSPSFDVQNNAGSPTMTIDWGVPTQSTAGVPSGVKAAVMLKQAEQALVNSPFTFIDLSVTADDRLVAVLDTTQENDPYLRIDGVNSMLADLDVGGNDIVNAGAVNATSANVSGDVTADRFIDRNNASTYLDPNNTSSVNVMDANIFRDRGNTAYYVNPAGTSVLNQVQADTFYDRNNTAFYANPAGRSMLQRVDTDIVYDRNNYSFYSNPDSVSRFNVVRPNYIEPQVTVTENTGCSPNGRIAKSSTGKILSCQSGIWKSGGGSGVQIDSTPRCSGTYCQGKLINNIQPIGMIDALNSYQNNTLPMGCSIVGHTGTLVGSGPYYYRLTKVSYLC